ncbi:unnamed protein product [Trichogramma brassicae]|uniref:Uncharacterized protein n=1 Tax=Trichogramma brassicae TaxID=86971 RepID=A0A6H5I8S0_9HYME|nr:unnamed protein product [Trichogramma brassicae]
MDLVRSSWWRRRSLLRKNVRRLSSQPRLRHHPSDIALSAAIIENASDAYGLDENLDSMHVASSTGKECEDENRPIT